MPLFVGQQTDAEILGDVILAVDRPDDLLVLRAGGLLGGR